MLEATVDNGLIVEVARITEDGDEAWFELASWVAATHPTAFEEAFGTINEGWILQPTYTGAAALTQAELAIMFARLTGSRTLPLG
ncbi:MAG: hypothetical protein OEM97_01695 [Acidimicrobiia bacterium]|nr:hypothetical protein [Acidimicrobiia bacterium]